jgi:hypothetical protein
LRRTVRGKTKAEVKDKLDKLHDEIDAGIRTPATYTVKQCVADWLDDLTLDPDTIATYRGQAEKWINPKIGAAKPGDHARDAETAEWAGRHRSPGNRSRRNEGVEGVEGR